MTKTRRRSKAAGGAVVLGGPVPQSRPKPIDVFIRIGWTHRGLPFIEAFAPKDTARIHFGEELYAPSVDDEHQRMLRRWLWHNLPRRLQHFLNDENTRLVAMHVVERRTPREELDRIRELGLLQAIEGWTPSWIATTEPAQPNATVE